VINRWLLRASSKPRRAISLLLTLRRFALSSELVALRFQSIQINISCAMHDITRSTEGLLLHFLLMDILILQRRFALGECISVEDGHH
jgi:hypothetical protein